VRTNVRVIVRESEPQTLRQTNDLLESEGPEAP
jgi:hypothetical protein